MDRQTDAHLTANSLRLGVYRRGVSLGCMASSAVHPLGCSPAVQEDAGVGGGGWPLGAPPESGKALGQL